MNADEYNDISTFLNKGEYPQYILQSHNQLSHNKANFRKKISLFRIGQNDKLYKVLSENQPNVRLEVVQEENVNDILQLYHDYSAHPGINSTIMKIREKYYWIGLSKYVRDYVNSCHICQVTANLPPQPQKKLKPIIPPEKPWMHIGIDLICDLEENVEGYKHVLVTVCYLSKYCAVRPLKTKTGSEVLKALQSIYLSLGVPKIIQHDQGPEFTNKAFQEFHRVLGIDNRSTTAYHPQSNGLVEAHNKFLKIKLNKIVLESATEWPNKLQVAVLAANTCWKRSTEYTPFYLMFGREANCEQLLKYHQLEDTFAENSNIISDSPDEKTYTLNDDLTEDAILTEDRSISQKLARNNIKFEQLKQQSIYNSKILKNRTEIKAGDDIIYINMPKLKKLPGTKDQAKFSGPVTTSQVTDSHCIISQDQNLKRKKKIPTHISKLYHQRSKPNKLKRKLNESLIDIPSKKTKSDFDEENNKKKKAGNMIFRDQIIEELNRFKNIFSQHFHGGSYMSELHEDLDRDSQRKGQYIPDTFLLKLLKDSSSEMMKDEILDSLIELAEELFPDTGKLRSCDYAFKVLYGVFMEYIQNTFSEASSSDTTPRLQVPKESLIIPYNAQWQKEKCLKLNIPYNTHIEHHHSYSNIKGQPLKWFKPWQCEDIVRDGNCLFRCLSKIISGDEKYHFKIRGEICRYLISEGREKIGGYLTQAHSTTPLKYLRSSGMLDSGTWGSDIEIMAASALLETDIYVASKYNSCHYDDLSDVRWNFIRGSNNISAENALYVTNFNSHYEPVYSMINSFYPTMFDDATQIETNHIIE